MYGQSITESIRYVTVVPSVFLTIPTLIGLSKRNYTNMLSRSDLLALLLIFVPLAVGMWVRLRRGCGFDFEQFFLIASLTGLGIAIVVLCSTGD